MSEFKFACPVCGQHIKCESWRSNTVMECPTCFQKITVPQPPATGDSKLIITGTKVGERPVPTGPADLGPVAVREKHIPLGVFVMVFLVCVVVAAIFVAREIMIKRAARQSNPADGQDNRTATTRTQPQPSEPPPMPPPPGPFVVVPANLPVAKGTNYWTLNINAIGTPAVPAGGKVHGRFFTAGRMVLNADGLTIRTADFPPEAGTTIYLRPNPIESLYGKSLLFETNTPGAPAVFLRWKNAQGQETDQVEPTGYALRIEFGHPASNYISGKIYLCTPDELKSYVVGNFNAEIVKPNPR
ncbi:MAG: hypothetical protein ABSC01_08825 [Verrucomicrobiota bacterium]|jgi:hypothetical protein